MHLPDFRPLPFLGNPHVQTILGAYLPGGACPPPRRRHVLRLPDGDAILAYDNRPARWQPGRPVALVVHGLSGWHRSPHVVRLAARLLAEGVRVFRVDLRGAGDGVALARGAYHAGRSADLRAVLAHLHSLSPGSALWLVGISLGGNMALKLAGEAAADPVPGLSAVAAMNPPIDMEACSELIALPQNSMYERRFVAALVESARQRGLHFPDAAPPAWPASLALRRFDDIYTAPRNGFRDAGHYYREASSAPLIPLIRVPTLVLTARDDPFIDHRPFEQLRSPPHVDVRIVEHGGHIGYIGLDGNGGIRWGERYVVEWLRRHFAT